MVWGQRFVKRSSENKNNNKTTTPNRNPRNRSCSKNNNHNNNVNHENDDLFLRMGSVTTVKSSEYLDTSSMVVVRQQHDNEDNNGNNGRNNHNTTIYNNNTNLLPTTNVSTTRTTRREFSATTTTMTTTTTGGNNKNQHNASNHHKNNASSKSKKKKTRHIRRVCCSHSRNYNTTSSTQGSDGCDDDNNNNNSVQLNRDLLLQLSGKNKNVQQRQPQLPPLQPQPPSSTTCSSSCRARQEDPLPQELQEQQQHEQQEKDILTERSVYDFVWAYMEEFTETAVYCTGPNSGISWNRWNDFWINHHTPDYLLVRPSGNTLDAIGLRTMFEQGDISQYSEQVVAVESIKVIVPNLMAVMIFRSEQEFMYMGTKEEDFATWTAVVVVHDGRLKFTNIHRSSGKKVNAVYQTNPCIPTKLRVCNVTSSTTGNQEKLCTTERGEGADLLTTIAHTPFRLG